jgi:hypothetical protein
MVSHFASMTPSTVDSAGAYSSERLRATRPSRRVSASHVPGQHRRAPLGCQIDQSLVSDSAGLGLRDHGLG